MSGYHTLNFTFSYCSWWPNVFHKQVSQFMLSNFTVSIFWSLSKLNFPGILSSACTEQHDSFLVCFQPPTQTYFRTSTNSSSLAYSPLASPAVISYFTAFSVTNHILYILLLYFILFPLHFRIITKEYWLLTVHEACIVSWNYMDFVHNSCTSQILRSDLVPCHLST